MSVAAARVRRARPLLGTIVEIGVSDRAHASVAIDAAFAAIADVESRLSRFACTSEVFRFNAARAGACIAVGVDARRVLAAAGALRDASDGLFDNSLGSGPRGWRCDPDGLHKLDDGVRIDLGGIGKGHAVDRGVAALLAAGAEGGWVNAGGDLRVFGAIEVPVDLRDENGGGVRRFATLADGAFATSRLAGAGHASVAAPECLWADALTKVVLASGDASHPLLDRLGARAWRH
jgi:thiamine biosynthesis lipoprotein